MRIHDDTTLPPAGAQVLTDTPPPSPAQLLARVRDRKLPNRTRRAASVALSRARRRQRRR